MVNKRQKGMRHELKVQKQLEKEGWITYRVKGSTKFNKDVDMFHLFDIFAIYGTLAQGHKIIVRKYIQVKSKKPSLVPFKEFKEKYCDNNDFVQIWTYKARKGFEIINI